MDFDKDVAKKNSGYFFQSNHYFLGFICCLRMGHLCFMNAKVLIYFNIRKFYHKFLSKYFEFPAFLFRNLEFPTLFT